MPAVVKRFRRLPVFRAANSLNKNPNYAPETGYRARSRLESDIIDRTGYKSKIRHFVMTHYGSVESSSLGSRWDRRVRQAACYHRLA